MQKGKHTKTPMEFSKKILVIAFAVSMFVTAFTCAMIWITCDLSPLQLLIPAVATEVTAGTGFYYNKAKSENEIKLRSVYRATEKEARNFEDASNI